jgi:hypothetical protein
MHRFIFITRVPKKTLSDARDRTVFIELEDITMYFLERKSPTKKQLKAYKSLESYNYFTIGLVYELFVRTFDDVKLLIATVKRSYRSWKHCELLGNY